MAQPTQFSSMLVMGGKVDSSLDKMVTDVQKKLGGLEKTTAGWQKGIAKIGQELVGLGTAFLGLRTGLSFFEDTVRQAQGLADITNELHGNLMKMFSTRDNATQLTIQFQKFNEELRKTSVYSQDISEAFESQMAARGFRPEVTQRLVKPMQQLAAAQGVKLTPEQSRAMADAWDKWVSQGNISGLQALGIPLTFAQKQQMQTMQRGNPMRPGEIIDVRERYAEQLLAQPEMRKELQGGFAAFRANPAVQGYELGQQVKGIQEDIGQQLLKILNPMAEGLSGWIQKNPDMAAKVAAGLAAGGPLLAGAIAKALAGWVFGGVEKKIAKALGEKVTGEMNVKAAVVNVYGAGAGGPGEAAANEAKKVAAGAIAGDVLGSAAGTTAGVGAGFGAMWLGGFLGSKIAEKYHVVPYDPKRDRWSYLREHGKEAPQMTAPLLGAPGGGPSAEQKRSQSELAKALGLPGYAEGGIVTSPQLALLGERGPEAVVPFGRNFDSLKGLDAVDKNVKNLKENTDITTELTKVMQELVDYEKEMGRGAAGVAAGGGGEGGGGAAGGGGEGGGGAAGGGGEGGGGAAAGLIAKSGDIMAAYSTPGGGGGGGIKGHARATATVEAAAAAAGGKGGGGASVYQKLLAAYKKSNLIGVVPRDGVKFGITTGSAEEWARFGTAVASAESSFNPREKNLSDPGGSFGIFQYAHKQVPGGNAYDVNASVAAFVRDSASSSKGLESGILGQRFSTIGSHPERTASRLAEAGKIASRSQPPEAIAQKARGGFIPNKMLSWLGEKGPEFVVPTARNDRSVGLLSQAAGALGMGVHEGGGGHRIHFNPNITINAAGHNAQELHQAVIGAIREQPQHLRRVLQDLYRHEQRTSIA